MDPDLDLYNKRDGYREQSDRKRLFYFYFDTFFLGFDLFLMDLDLDLYNNDNYRDCKILFYFFFGIFFLGFDLFLFFCGCFC